MAYRIFSYTNTSKSALMLKEALGALFIKHKGSEYKPEPGDCVFNWGSSENKPVKMLNPSVWPCIDKLKFFTNFAETGYLPPFATTKAQAEKLAFPVVCRTQLQGCDGAGIVIAETPAELVPAKLYTQYIKKDQEYRVHVGKNPDGTLKMILVQRKGKKSGSTNKNWQIRTTSNDFVFVHSGFITPTAVMAAAVAVFKATGMDFGGLDVIYQESTNKAYVLEVNSAPELGETSCNAYVSFFQQFHTAVDKPVVESEVGEPAAIATASSGSMDASGSAKPVAPNGSAAVPPKADLSGGNPGFGLTAKKTLAFFEAELTAAFNLGKASVVIPKIDTKAIETAAYDKGVKDGIIQHKAQLKALFS